MFVNVCKMSNKTDIYKLKLMRIGVYKQNSTNSQWTNYY